MAICEEKLEEIRGVLNQLRSIMDNLRPEQNSMILEAFLDLVETSGVFIARDKAREMFKNLNPEEQEALREEYKALGKKWWCAFYFKI